MKPVDPNQYNAQQNPGITQENQLIEEAKRILYARCKNQPDVFTTPAAAKDYLRLQLAEKQQEVFVALFLTSQHQLIAYQELFKGSIDSCSVYPREVVKEAIRLNAAAVIFAHNHPSGIADPSQSDRRITERLKAALQLIDVNVLDHFIIGEGEVFSFAEKGYL